MSDSDDVHEVDLGVLAKRLVIEGMPAQKVIASEAGVSQPTVSRAIRGQIKGPSRSARKLWVYAAERLAVLRKQREKGDPLPSQRGAEPRRKHASSSAQPAGKGGLRRRRAPVPRRRSETDETPPASEDRQQLAEAAIAGLRDYLDDAFDPLLVIEQLAVLRRAQDPARRRGVSDMSGPAKD